MFVKLARTLGIATVIAAMGAIASTARADTIFSTGFEDPPFAAGALVAATDGWSSISFQPVDIVTDVYKSGAQSIRQTNAAGGNSGIFRSLSESTANRIFTLSLDYLNQGDSLNKITLGGGIIFVRTLGGSTDVFLAGDDGNTASEIIDNSLWHHLEMVLNYTTNKVSASVDGTNLGTKSLAPSPFLGDFSHVSAFGSTDQFIYDDNVSLNATAAPLPSVPMAGLALFGGMALLKFRRRELPAT